MKIAVIRGTQEKLVEMGMEIMLDGAELVIEVPGDDQHRINDRYGQTYDVRFIEVDTPEQAVAECFVCIKRSWEESHPKDAHHLGHAAAGFWYFYWFSTQMEPMSTLLARGDVDALRAAAGDYISAGYGEYRGPTLAQDLLEEPEWKAETPVSTSRVSDQWLFPI